MFEPKFKQMQTKPACPQRDGRGMGFVSLNVALFYIIGYI